MSLLFANYGQDPLWQFDLTANSGKAPERRDARQTATKMKEIAEYLQAEILRAQQRHQEQADRRQAPALAFRIGDRVWLNAQNITTQRPSQKLDYRRIGPYGITKVVSPYTYKIDFPATVKYQ